MFCSHMTAERPTSSDPPIRVDDMPETRPQRAMTATWRASQRRACALTPSGMREIAVSAMIVMIVAIGVLFNLPDAAITRAVSPLLSSIALPLGLDQNWSMYAPNPPRRQEDIEVHVALADGSERAWAPPRLNPIFGVAFSHRWRRFKESLVTQPQIRPDFVRWVVRELTDPADRPVHVEMLLRTKELPPPGVSEAGRTTVQILYSENLTGSR